MPKQKYRWVDDEDDFYDEESKSKEELREMRKQKRQARDRMLDPKEDDE